MDRPVATSAGRYLRRATGADGRPTCVPMFLHEMYLSRPVRVARMGAVYVQWYRDRVEVSSPGGFPEGVCLDNLLVVPPQPRNPRLADAFKRLGLVERSGRGTDIIYEGCIRNGHAPPDYTGSTESFVKVVIPGGRPDMDFVRRLLAVEQGRTLSVEELLVAWHARERGSITAEVAARVVQRPVRVADAVLRRLAEMGLLKAGHQGWEWKSGPLAPD